MKISPILALKESKTWAQFKAQIDNLSSKEKGDSFELLTKYYLQVAPKYASQLRNIWLLKEVPEEIRVHLNLPDEDKGIDLVMETKEGNFWSIQCKYREDETKSLTWSEVSTFTGLTFGRCHNFSFGLICTSTEKFTAVLKDQEKIGFCTSEIWQSMDEEIFGLIHALLDHRPLPLNPFIPRPHQKKAVESAVDYFVKKDCSRGKLIMPCGSGKSLTSFWIAEALDSKRTIIAVPSLSLIQQSLNVWLRESIANKKNVSWLCVCGDETAGEINNDDVIVHIQDLGIPCLTNESDIAERLRDMSDRQLIIFTTYQSSKRIAEASRLANFKYDLGIFDEAHKTVGQKEKLFSHLLHDQNIEIKKRIFMTATERRYSGDSDRVLSMDNSEIYGDTFELMTFKEALESNPPILSDYKILTIVVGKKEVREMVKTNIFIRSAGADWDDDIEAESLATVIALRKAMKDYPIRHAVSFHSSIKRAQLFKKNQDLFTKKYQEYEPLKTFHVSGKTPAAVRERQLRDFAKNKTALVTNARCLNEGVDIPNIDCVLFADARKSIIDIVQAAGRALRPASGKEFGYIIIPVLIDETKSGEELITGNAFSAVISTLRSLASNDERIIEYFRSISHGKTYRGGGSTTICIDERLAKFIDISAFAQAIEIKCWSRLAKLAIRPFHEAREFARSLDLNNYRQWREYCLKGIEGKEKLPEDIPIAADQVYEDSGWAGWNDWLGTQNFGPGQRKHLSFEDAKKYVRNLKLRNGKEWQMYCAGKISEQIPKPVEIPSTPSLVYKDKGWVDMRDWLGLPVLHLSFEEARDVARGSGIKTFLQWREEAKHLPKNIPRRPEKTYKNAGWISWGDWLGTGNLSPSRKLLSYKKARVFARNLKLKTWDEWFRFCNGEFPEKGALPQDVPIHPEVAYEDEWRGVSDWLGTGQHRVLGRHIMPYEEAKNVARSFSLKNFSEWEKFYKGKMPEKGEFPFNLPVNPAQTYANKGWIGWGDWLGDSYQPIKSRTRGSRFLPYEDGKKIVSALRLRSSKQWRDYTAGKIIDKGNLPENIPTNPNRSYAGKGWIGWGDWLGIDETRDSDK